MSFEPFGRIKSTAEEFRNLQGQHSRELAESYRFQDLIHRAHVIMLQEAGILRREEAAKILKGLSKLRDEIKKDAELASYMRGETYLISEIGEVGGKMHIGRSRNDLNATCLRMLVRERLSTMIEETIDYSKTLLEVAGANVGTVMPSYTHWQNAQPSTFGHYILAHVDAGERVIGMLENAYRTTNLCPLGAAALTGTGWPISRERTAKMLGFKGVLENTLDCVASRDYMAEGASAITLMLCNLSRLAEDLQIWNSSEFCFVEIDQSYAASSSIMPQKKNPVALEHVKAHAASAIGQLVEILASMKGVAYTNARDMNECEGAFVRLTANAIAAIRVMRGLVSTLALNTSLMLLRASDGFSTMSELADTLVREMHLDFRTAHEVVARLVDVALGQGKTAGEITSQMLNDASHEVTGRTIHLSEASLRAALNPLEFVRKRGNGGPSPAAVRHMIRRRKRNIAIIESRHAKEMKRLKSAFRSLETAQKFYGS